MKKTLILTSLLAIVAITGVANADTDVTFAGDYELENGTTANVGTGAPSAYGFSYTGTNADGTNTASIASNTTTGVNKSNFEYTLADGVTTEDLSLENTYTASQYTADTVAGTTGYENVSVESGYGLDAATSVTAGNYYYINPQGGTKQLVLDSSNNPVVDSLTTEFAYSEASQQFTNGVSAIEVNNASTTLDGTAYTLLTDTAGNVYTLSADGAGILMNGVAYTGTPVGELETNFNDAQAAYNADALLFADAVSDLGDEQTLLNANAVQAKNAFVSDTNTQGDLVANYATYMAAQTAYTDANTEYESTLSSYNADSASYAAAADLYNSPIETTIANGANDAIEASIADGAIKIALDGKADASALDGKADVADVAANAAAIANRTVSVTGGVATVSDGTNTADVYTKDFADEVFAAKEAWVGQQLGFDTTTTDAKTELQANGFAATDFLGAVVENKNSIATEAQARADADTALQQNITAEQNARIAGDELTLNAAKAYADAGNELAINRSKAYTDERVEKLDKDLSAGVASAVALSSVSVSGVKKGEVSVGGGYGYFNGQSAAALGAAMGLSDRWSINAGAGLSSSDVSFRAGTNYKFKLF